MRFLVPKNKKKTKFGRPLTWCMSSVRYWLTRWKCSGFMQSLAWLYCWAHFHMAVVIVKRKS